jgi:hypothetical protein
MKRAKIAKLRKHGYWVTDTQEFLGLSDEEMALIDLKISLIEKLKETRRLKRITQHQSEPFPFHSSDCVAFKRAGR